jgi:hypothetical protein
MPRNDSSASTRPVKNSRERASTTTASLSIWSDVEIVSTAAGSSSGGMLSMT